VAYLSAFPWAIARVASALAGGAPRLIDQPSFRAATSHLAAGTGFVAYSDVLKVLTGTYRLVEHECGAEAAGRLPTLEEFSAGVTPLVASLARDDDGFTFDVRSPHGLATFFLELAAHVAWRFDVEPMLAREKELRPEFDRVMADADRAKDPRRALEILTPLVKKTSGTRLRDELEAKLVPIRTQLAGPVLEDVLKELAAIPDPQEKIDFLAKAISRPELRGTEQAQQLRRQMRRLMEETREAPDAPTPRAPEGDVDEVF
jgi:hypothetical protein